MGAGLPKAVTSAVVERHEGDAFRVGLAEMNCWRSNMEDAHVIYTQSSWGFFGVFDGHGGEQCSAYIAKRVTEELERNGAPQDEAAIRELVFRLDQEFLETGQLSGSTGTFAIVKKPSSPGGKYHLRVGNIGDSRVLLGRADGSIFAGPGTDSGLTTDHKPDLDSERERIERTGGTVDCSMGVLRVNGDLAVSRSFGDATHKRTGGPSPEDRPVTAAPEVQDFECDPTDFLMLVCDGVSEGNFPNAQVVKLAADNLAPCGVDQAVDPARAALKVCHEAIRCGSKDNISCMIVLLGGGDNAKTKKDFIPGPYAVGNGNFEAAYTAAAKSAGLTLAHALEKRYALLEQVRARVKAGEQEFEESPGEKFSEDSVEEELKEFGHGPEESLRPGSEERIQWFDRWLAEERSQGKRAAPCDTGFA